MCLSERFPILKRLDVLGLGRILRWIALFEGVLAILAVTIIVTLLGLCYETLKRQGTGFAAASKSILILPKMELYLNRNHLIGEQMTKIAVLSVFILQAVFALILHEGARKKVLWMIKVWLFFCLLRLLIPITMVISNLFQFWNKQLPEMVWTMGYQATLLIFHCIEATFVISFHTKAEAVLRSKSLMTIEYHRNTDSLDEIIEMKEGNSDASISVNIEHEYDSGI